MVAAAGRKRDRLGWPVCPAAFESEAPPSPEHCQGAGVAAPRAKAASRPPSPRRRRGRSDPTTECRVSAPRGRPGRLAATRCTLSTPDEAEGRSGSRSQLAGTSMSRAMVAPAASAECGACVPSSNPARREWPSSRKRRTKIDSRMWSSPESHEFCLGDICGSVPKVARSQGVPVPGPQRRRFPKRTCLAPRP